MIMACPHVEAQELCPPGPNQPVYKDECTQCFDSVDHLNGMDVCLYCFNGGCLGDTNHSKHHYERTSHPLALNIKRVRKPIKRDQPPHKISKLAIAAETEDDRYETHTKVVCYKCNQDNIDRNTGKLPSVVEGILKASTFAKREEVKAWEQELTPCEHTLMLNQESPRQIASQDLGHCSMCDVRENLWLCLQCGNLGCGRAQFGGVGGNSHGLAHSDQTHHPVAVKLGSITPDGAADVHCYSCNEERTDPQLSAHLAHWGIKISEREKTEKSLTELQIDQNLRWEFSMTTEDGKDLKPVFGPSLTGLKNLGNSCYLASIMQCLMALRCFQARYEFPMHPPPMSEHPAEDFETQMRKMADGLLSGRWSEPDPDVSVSAYTPELHYQKGVAPAMFKHLIGRGHQEFSTMRQQDAYEFLLHLFKMIRRSPHPKGLKDPTIAFRFVMEQRLQCLHCKRVRYRQDEQDNVSVPIPARMVDVGTASTDDITISAEGKDPFAPVTLEECLNRYTGEDVVQLTCPACGSNQSFSTRTMFKTFPDILAINCQRFQLVNWVPTKLDIPVVVSNQHLRLDQYLSKGLQDDEELLPEDGPSDFVNVFEPNAEALSQLEAMGFPRVRGERALQATGNVDAEAAMNWLFKRMDDADLDTPLHQAKEIGAGGSVEVDPEKVDLLGVMGFSAAMAKKALRETGGDTERAVDWLFSHPDEVGIADHTVQAHSGPAASSQATQELAGSDRLPAQYQLHSIVCHKGTSIHAGHYVAFIRKFISKEDITDWVLFNDEKVVKAVDADEMKKFAYIYFFQRV